MTYHGFTPDQRRTFGALMRIAAMHRKARHAALIEWRKHNAFTGFAEQCHTWDAWEIADAACNKTREHAKEYACRIQARGQR